MIFYSSCASSLESVVDVTLIMHLNLDIKLLLDVFDLLLELINTQLEKYIYIHIWPKHISQVSNNSINFHKSFCFNIRIQINKNGLSFTE